MRNQKIIFAYLIFALLLAVPPLLALHTANNDLLIPHFWAVYTLICGLTFAAIVFVLTIQQVNKEMFAPAFLGATTFKLLACLVFVLIFTRKYHPQRLVFVADFIYLYFLNTAFEVYALLRNLRNQNLK